MRTLLYLGILVYIGSLALPLMAQKSPCDTGPTSSTVSAPPFGQPIQQGPNQALADMQKQQAKARNKERHSSLKKDTDKLVQLAAELKERVDKSNENQLSLEVIHKSQEIEKLAKSVREKMTANGYCDLSQ